MALHKLRDLGITGKLTNRTHFTRLPRSTNQDSKVLSGVPQGTILGLLLFLIMISDISKDISSSNLLSFADNTRVYNHTP